jgi:glucan biosynthesis protein C
MTPQRPDHPDAAPPRLHALDNLRALMMWLGIVLHVAVIHQVQPPLLPWRDGERTMVADLLVAFIHSFRMPVFFILAGFFVALLLQSRGPGGLAAHRLQRLGLPFLVFWPPLFVVSGVFALMFLHRMVRGTWGLDLTLMPHGPTIPQGPGTMHMWFLWQLLWLSLAAAAVARGSPAPLRRAWSRAAAVLQTLGARSWGFAVLALPLVAMGWNYPNGFLTPDGSFLPAWTEWVHNGLFFAFGLALYHQQWELFSLYQRRWAAYAAAGLVAFFVSGGLLENKAHAGWIAFAYNACTWLWCFALLGLGTRFLAAPRRPLAYLAESSYWVYLVHMPLTILFGAMLYGMAWPALLKMAVNIAATTTVCLVSYHLAVRSTWLGVLLNGKRRPATPLQRGFTDVATS